MEVLKSPLRGVVPPMLTPLIDGDRLDVDGLERLIEHMIGGGVHGLFILGTTGEAAALSGNLRRELIQRTCKQVAGRIPVLVGVTDTSMADSLELARYAAGVGAHAAVITSPYYIPLEQAELVHYVGEIAAEQPLPVMLYNIPQLTKTAYEPETLKVLIDHPRIIGIKDSSGNASYLTEIHSIFSSRPELSVLVGTETMMAGAVQAGIHGAVPGGANVFPRLLVKLYEAAVANDTLTIDQLQAQLVILGNIYRINPGMSAIIKAIKCAMGHLKICSERMADPFLPLNVGDRKKVRHYLDMIDYSRFTGEQPKILQKNITASVG
jgi:dihydrodipicolinate synthase/N-acetylneuraminate lyase